MSRRSRSGRATLCNDATVKKPGELLRDNPHGILLYRDELGGFLRGMESEGHEQDRAFYLEAWDGGGRFTYDRIGRGTIEIDSCCVSIIGAMCPAPLQAWVSSRAISGTGADGLLQRFQLAVWPDSSSNFVNVDRRPDASAAARMKSALRRLATIGDDIQTREQVTLAGEDDEDAFVTAILRFNEAAQEAFDDWRERLERRIREPDIVPAWESHLGKYRSLAPSLALIFHLLDQDSDRIGLDAWLRAEAWVEYLEAHARRIYDGFLRPHVTPAHALARKIKSGALTSPFKLRDVYRPQWSGLTTRAEAEFAVETLVDAGWLVPEDKAGPLGRPTVVYHINPKCKGGAA